MSTRKILLVLPLFFLAQSCNVFAPFGLGGAPSVGGVLKSVDSGENWESMNTTIDQGTIGGVSFARIRIDPGDAKKIYLASPTGGVFKSEDSATSWANILSNSQIFDLKISDASSSEILAGGSTGGVAKLYKTEDTGQTWTESYSESKADTFVSAITYDPRNSKIIYIGLNTGEIIQSTNGGVSWLLMGKIKGRVLKIEIKPFSGQSLRALSMSEGLHQSSDGGKTWTSIFRQDGITKYFDYSSQKTNDSLIYTATDKGLYRSLNTGGNWEKLQLPLHDDDTQVTAVHLNLRDEKVIFSIIGSTLYKSTDRGNTWQTRSLTFSGTVRDVATDDSEQNVMYMALGNLLQ